MAKIRDVMIVSLPAEWQGRGLVFGSASSGDGPPLPEPPEASLRDWDIFELRMMAQILLARLGGPVALGDMEPQSLREIDELEGRLSAALEELRAARAGWKKRKSALPDATADHWQRIQSRGLSRCFLLWRTVSKAAPQLRW